MENQGVIKNNRYVIIKASFSFVLLVLMFLSTGCKKEIEHSDTTLRGLPILYIVTDRKEEINTRETYLKGTVMLNGGSEFESISSSLEIRGRGNSTWNSPKKPYQIKFAEKQSLLGMPEDKKWILLANYTDKTMLRNEIGFNLSRLSTLTWTPESRFIELFVNDEYQGTYQLTQKVEKSDNRVDIGDEGFLLEVDQLDRLGSDDVYFETDYFLYNVKEPKLVENDEQYLYIKNYMVELETALFGEEFKDSLKGYRKYINVNDLIDWYLINEITKNNDADFYTSVFMHYKVGEKLKLGPVWDFDISLGNIDYNGNETTDGFWMKRGKWMKQLFKDPLFVEEVKSRFQFFYSNKRMICDKILSNAEYIQESQIENYEKWKTLGIYVWPNNVYFETYEEEVDYLKNWLEERLDWLDIEINKL